MAVMGTDGADERQVAQALFLTPRTVQVTLGSFRSRLRVGSNAELGPALEPT